ncbi:MAG: DUF808 domain-containing protein [Pseudomonadota bacterium]
MSGLLALLDDVAAIAKIAATSVDDIVGQATKTGAQAAGAVIDDAAVTPNYVQGFSADRELPIVWRIARGSLFNKLVILLPIAMALSAFAPWVIPGLLLLGGAYLCYEGAEKVAHVFGHASAGAAQDAGPASAAHLEQARVRGAIKTDFVLSAEIMTIALAALPEGSLIYEAAILAVVAVGITALVYGSVALIVKADDFGLYLARDGRSGFVQSFGRSLVRAMPGFMRLLTTVGTAAMLWVGGAIILHALNQMGFTQPEHLVHDLAVAVSQAAGAAQGLIEWLVTATTGGVLGLLLGLLLLSVASLVERLFR